MIETCISIIKLVVFIIVLLVWTFIGFIFWIPLLTRTTALFSAGILISLFSQTPERSMVHFKFALEVAISFYIEGYRQVFKALYPKKQNGISFFIDYIEFDWIRFIWESVWTAIFWATIIFALYKFK